MLLTRRALLTSAAGIAAAPALLPALGPASEIRPGIATARTGGRQRFPNVPLLTQNGERVRFYDDLVKGKIVMINAFYATCNGICPRGTRTLREVQERLGDRVGREVFMYSLTLKPAEDTPDVLKDYAETYDVAPGWTFLTGRPEDCELLRRRLGFQLTDPKLDADTSQHTGSVLAGNETIDRWLMCPTSIPAVEILRGLRSLRLDVGELPPIK